MAVNPLISLQAQAPDIGQTFSNTLLNLGRIRQIQQARQEAPQRARILESQAQAAEAAVPTAQAQFNVAQRNRINSVAVGAREILPDLKAGNITRVISTLQNRASSLEKAGIDNSDTLEAIDLATNDPNTLIQQATSAIDMGAKLGAFTPKGSASPKAFAPIIDPKTGKLSSTVFDPQTSTFRQVEVPGVTQLTPEQKTGLEIKEAKEKSVIEISEAGAKERIKLREKRSSEITAELSERNRGAARSGRTLRKALTLAKKSSQGLKGAATLQLSRLIPGIDASDEGSLDSALKELALEQLQQFKGPTTDFEFGVTESIAGSLGQSQSSNIARLKSLDRASWFNQREFDQFDKHVKSGGDPDTFKFNFGEPIKTKKGVFTLQDIQDTAVKNTLTIEETIKRLNK